MATSDIVSLTGIVMRVTAVKDHDAMVFCIGEEGFFSFYAHGGKKMTSPFSSSLILFTLGTYILRKSSSGSLTLKEVSKSEPLVSLEAPLEQMACATCLAEIITKIVQEEDAKAVYPYIYGAFRTLKEGKDPLTASLICFAHVLSISGFELDVSECVSCGNKEHIVACSYQDGGFLCSNCAQENYVEQTPLIQLKILRYIFKAPISDYGRVSLEILPAKRVFMDLGHYVHELTGVELKSISFLSSI